MIRARPLLGTTVEIRVDDPSDDAANAAIDRGFAAIADIHRLMSFHEGTSDISRLNREAVHTAAVVDPRTFEVLRRAQDFSARSNGLFDITTAGRLVEWGFLPKPNGAPAPDARARWSDVVLEDLNRVRFRRPLWIDLGGIAKGFAVDQAIAAMHLARDIQAVVNAGGDLRVAGPRAERVRLRSALAMDAVPVVEIEDGALASSSGREQIDERGGEHGGQRGATPYVGRDGESIGADRLVSVAAQDCLSADALTKVVLAAGAEAEPVLGHFGAIAYVYAPNAGWTTFGA